jgi:hypothetical protein
MNIIIEHLLFVFRSFLSFSLLIRITERDAGVLASNYFSQKEKMQKEIAAIVNFDETNILSNCYQLKLVIIFRKLTLNTIKFPLKFLLHHQPKFNYFDSIFLKSIHS